MRGALRREKDDLGAFITTASTQRRTPPRAVDAAVRLQVATINTVGVCSTPEVDLLGTVDDWRAIRARTEIITEYPTRPWGCS